MAKNKEIDIDALIDEQFGDSVINLSKIDGKVPYWLDTGVYSINYQISKNLRNGYPGGRVIQIAGLSGTGKSMFASYAGKDPQVDKVFIIDSEGGGNGAELVDFLGIAREKIKIFKAKTLENYRVNKSTMKIERVADKEVPAKLDTDTYIYYEGATRIVKKIIDTLIYNSIKAKILIIVDSIGNMKSVRELEGTQDMGAKAVALNSFFGSIVNDIEKTNATLIFTNKMYQKLDGSFDPYVISGGESVIYNPSITLRLATTAETDDMTDAEMKLEKEQRKSSLGASIKTLKAIVSKSRFGTEGRNAQFIIDFSSGPFRYSGLFKLLVDFGVIQKVGASARYVLPELFGDTSFFKKDFIQMMIDTGEEGIDKLQKALESSEERMREDRKKYQYSSDIEEVAEVYQQEHEEAVFDNQELVNSMTQEEEDSVL